MTHRREASVHSFSAIPGAGVSSTTTMISRIESREVESRSSRIQRGLSTRVLSSVVGTSFERNWTRYGPVMRAIAQLYASHRVVSTPSRVKSLEKIHRIRSLGFRFPTLEPATVSVPSYFCNLGALLSPSMYNEFESLEYLEISLTASTSPRAKSICLFRAPKYPFNCVYVISKVTRREVKITNGRLLIR